VPTNRSARLESPDPGRAQTSASGAIGGDDTPGYAAKLNPLGTFRGGICLATRNCHPVHGEAFDLR